MEVFSFFFLKIFYIMNHSNEFQFQGPKINTKFPSEIKILYSLK